MGATSFFALVVVVWLRICKWASDCQHQSIYSSFIKSSGSHSFRTWRCKIFIFRHKHRHGAYTNTNMETYTNTNVETYTNVSLLKSIMYREGDIRFAACQEEIDTRKRFCVMDWTVPGIHHALNMQVYNSSTSRNVYLKQKVHIKTVQIICHHILYMIWYRITYHITTVQAEPFCVGECVCCIRCAHHHYYSQRCRWTASISQKQQMA